MPESQKRILSVMTAEYARVVYFDAILDIYRRHSMRLFDIMVLKYIYKY